MNTEDFKIMQHGGARLNAGRKPKAPVLVRQILAAEILGSVDEVLLWQGLLGSENEKIKLEALKYLTDRRDGKAPQSMVVGPEDTRPVEMTFSFHRPHETNEDRLI